MESEIPQKNLETRHRTKTGANLDTSAIGATWVEILDQEGAPTEGYQLKDCDVIHSCNAINRTVTWSGQGDVSGISGHPVKLHFVMRDANLYAIQFRMN